MKLNNSLIVLGLLTSSAAMAGAIDQSALGNSARQSIDVTFTQPISVTHTLVKEGGEFVAGIVGEGNSIDEERTTLAQGKVTVTAGDLEAMHKTQAITPTVPGKENAGPDYVTGMAVNARTPEDNFPFRVYGKEVKVVNGKNWLLGAPGKEMKYSVTVNKGTKIKAGMYKISIEAAIYSE